MKKYRVYEAFRNPVGGVEGCGTGWEHITAATAKEAAEAFWQSIKCIGAVDEDHVIVATDDDGDSHHYYPGEVPQ